MCIRDSPTDKMSGLVEAERLLCKTDGIRFVHFSELDVVRHPLVQEVIRAYNHSDNRKGKDGPAKRRSGCGGLRTEYGETALAVTQHSALSPQHYVL